MFILEDKSYDADFSFSLNEDQIEAVEFLLTHPYSVLALGTGNGKTLVALTTAYTILKNQPNTVCVVLMPKSANSIFCREMREKIKLPYSIYTSDTKATNPKARFWFFNYTNLAPFKQMLSLFKKNNLKVIAIFDEAHTLQSGTSNICKELSSIRQHLSIVYGLSATPLLNDIAGLYNLVNFVYPNYLGSYLLFSSRYLILKERTIRIKGKTKKIKEISGYKNIEHLKALLDKITFVKRKYFNLRWFYRPAKITDRDLTIYKIASKGLTGEESEKQFGSRLHDLQRICDGVFENYKLSKTKLYLTIDIVREIRNRDEGVIIFVDYIDTFNLLKTELTNTLDKSEYGAIYGLSGETEYKKRLEIETNLSKRDILIITRAASQSLNLQKVNNVILYSTSFSVGVVLQTLGRITRVDSKYDTFNVYLPYIESTIDEYRIELFKLHSNLIEYLFGKDTSLPNTSEFVDLTVVEEKRHYMKKKFLWK